MMKKNIFTDTLADENHGKCFGIISQIQRPPKNMRQKCVANTEIYYNCQTGRYFTIDSRGCILYFVFLFCILYFTIDRRRLLAFILLVEVRDCFAVFSNAMYPSPMRSYV